MKTWLMVPALIVLIPTGMVRAGEPAAPPTFVVRVRSIDTLIQNAKLLVTLAGREEIAQQVEGLIQAKIGAKGLEGIDTKRPLGAYGRFGKEIDDIAGAVLVPIADEKAFVGLLEDQNLMVTKAKDGLYTVQTGTPIEVYIRFANRYAYLTAMNPSAIDKDKLPDPMQVLGKVGPTFSASLRIDQLPEAARQIASAQIEQGLDDALQKEVPNETPAQKDLRIAAAKETIKMLIGIIKEGAEMKVSVDLDGQKKQIAANLSLSGKPGTGLAKAIQDVGQRPSQFGALRSPEAAFRGAVHVVLPEEMKKSLAKLLEEATSQGIEKIQDDAKRAQAAKLLEALAPTIRAAEADAVVQLIGPDASRKYAVLAAVKVAEARKLGKVVEELIQDALRQAPAQVKGRVQLNAITIGDTKVHRFELPDDKKEIEKLRELTGETNLHVAFGNNAVFVAVGKAGLDLLKNTVNTKSAGASPLFLLEVDMARLGALAPTQELRNAAKQMFAGGKDSMIRVAVEGGAALRLSITTPLAVVQFLAQARDVHGQN
jgi:hypothetical protein